MLVQKSKFADIFTEVAGLCEKLEKHDKFATDVRTKIDDEVRKLGFPDTDLLEQPIIEGERFDLKLKKLCTEVIACSSRARKLRDDMYEPDADVMAIAAEIGTVCSKQNEMLINIIKMLDEPEDKKCCCCSLM